MLGLPGQLAIYLMVDAFDECPDTSGVVPPRERVNLIEDLVELHLPNLRTCVTSWPEADHLETLLPLISHSVSLHEEKQDISDYISSVVQSDREMRKWGPADRQMVIDTLAKRADGMSVSDTSISE